MEMEMKCVLNFIIFLLLGETLRAAVARRVGLEEKACMRSCRVNLSGFLSFEVGQFSRLI